MIVSNVNITKDAIGVNDIVLSYQNESIRISRSSIRSIYIHMGMKGVTPQEKYIKILLQNGNEILISCENESSAKTTLRNLTSLIRD